MQFKKEKCSEKNKDVILRLTIKIGKECQSSIKLTVTFKNTNNSRKTNF